MMIELVRNGLHARSQEPISVYYKNDLVGDYFADIIIDNRVILELKAAEIVVEEHGFQLINYLKSTEIKVRFLLNFGKKPEIRMKIFTNDRKEIIDR